MSDRTVIVITHIEERIFRVFTESDLDARLDIRSVQRDVLIAIGTLVLVAHTCDMGEHFHQRVERAFAVKAARFALRHYKALLGLLSSHQRLQYSGMRRAVLFFCGAVRLEGRNSNFELWRARHDLFVFDAVLNVTLDFGHSLSHRGLLFIGVNRFEVVRNDFVGP